MSNNDDHYYDDYYDDDYSFTAGYDVTTVYPGYDLLAIAVGYSVLCIFIGYILRCCRRRRKSMGGVEKHSRKNDSGGHDLISNEVKPETASSGGNNLSYESIEAIDVSVRNAIGMGLVDLNTTDDFDFIFVDKFPSLNKSRKFHSRINCRRSSAVLSASVSNASTLKNPASTSIRSVHSVSIKESSSSKISFDDNPNITLINRISQGQSGKIVSFDNTPDITLIDRAGSAQSETRNASLDQASTATYHTSYQQLEDVENDLNANNTPTPEPEEEEEVTYMSEIKNMFKLAGPWAFSEFIVSTASIITVGIISHYIGTAEMICYSYVWFFIDAANIVSTALYTSLYKHVNNAAAKETDDGYNKAGKFVRIAIYFNFIISIPISFILIFSVGPIMRLYGYGNKIAKLSQKYTVLASVSQFISTSTGYASLIPDIEGHADFDALFGLVDSGIDILIALFLVPWFHPSLLQLGLIHVAQDLLSIIVYYFITGYRNRWYDKNLKGFLDPLDFKIRCGYNLGAEQFEGKDSNLVVSLIGKTIPMTFDVFTGEAQWIVLTFFAAHLGAAEAASWVLVSYIWGFVGIVPNNLASAFEYRISNLLSNDNVALARRMANAAVWMTIFSSALSCAVLFFSRNLIVDGVTSNEIIKEMLLEIIPYIVLCDPLMAPSTAASYLNRALAMYQRSAKLELLVTIFVSIPAAIFSTYKMNYNIEGLAAATYAGYATMAVFVLYIYFTADWNKAIAKNKKIGGECDIEEISITDSSGQSVSSRGIITQRTVN